MKDRIGGNNDGKISKEEIYNKFSLAGLGKSIDLDKLAQQNIFLDKYDGDNDGELTREEFTNMCNDKEYAQLAMKFGRIITGERFIY